jgi:hypothetical protein
LPRYWVAVSTQFGKDVTKLLNLGKNGKKKKGKRRIRKPGGGRKPYDVTHPDIDAKFLKVLKYYTAGDPMDETVLWTNLHPAQIATLMYTEYGLKVSKTVIRKLLKKRQREEATHHTRCAKHQNGICSVQIVQGLLLPIPTAKLPPGAVVSLSLDRENRFCGQYGTSNLRVVVT